MFSRTIHFFLLSPDSWYEKPWGEETLTEFASGQRSELFASYHHCLLLAKGLANGSKASSCRDQSRGGIQTSYPISLTEKLSRESYHTLLAGAKPPLFGLESDKLGKLKVKIVRFIVLERRTIN